MNENQDNPKAPFSLGPGQRVAGAQHNALNSMRTAPSKSPIPPLYERGGAASHPPFPKWGRGNFNSGKNFDSRYWSSPAQSRVSIVPHQSRSLPYFLFALISLSIGAASIENGLHPLLLVILPVVFVALSRPDYSRSFGLSERGWGLLFLVYSVMLFFAFVSIRGRISLPLFFVYFAFGILVVRVFCPLTDRHVSQVILLTVGLVVINCILTNDMLFGLVLPAYLFVLMATLLLFHLAKNRTTLGEIGSLPKTGPLRTRWYGKLAIYVLFLLPFTVVMFVFVPRPFIMLPGLSAPMVNAGGMARLEQQISYRDMVNMANRQRIAFMVTLEQGTLPYYPYWRGRVLEKNDGRSWYSDERAKSMGKITRFQQSEVVKYQFIPYRLQSRTVYVNGLPLMVTGRLKRPLQITNRGEVLVDMSMVLSDSYSVRAVDKLVPISDKDSRANLDRTGISRSIEKLAIQWTSRFNSPREKAAALASQLRKNYRYRLDIPAPPPDVNPSEYFLFQTRAGHCEYFAGTLCLMLRALGIPARVVEGFAGAELTDVTGEFIVRFANAHAWVEAIVDTSGWTPLDPTPPAPAESGYSQLWRILGDVYDRLDYLWVKQVVYFDRSDQTAMYKGLGDLLAGKTPLSFTLPRLGPSYLVAGLAAALLLIAMVMLAYGRRRKSGGLSAIYISTMEKVVKMGMLDRVHPWHERNVREIVGRAPNSSDAVGRFMQIYLSGRFGRPDDAAPDELRKARTDLLEDLRAARPRDAGQ